MKKWTKFVCLFAAMAILLSACGPASEPGPAESKDPNPAASTPANVPGNRTQTLFGTGTPGGVYEILGTGMVNILNQHLTDTEMVAVTPAQIQQLPAMLQSGEASIVLRNVVADELLYVRAGLPGPGGVRRQSPDRYCPAVRDV